VKDVKILATTQIRLFQPDMIPLNKLALQQHRETIHSLFSFQNNEPLVRQEMAVGIRFNNGSYGPKSILIPEVSIEGRRIIIRIQGTSKEAKLVYEMVKGKLEKFNDNRPIREILCTHETSCSITLGVPFERLFSQSFLSFIDKSATKYTRNQWSENYIALMNLKFSVSYKLTDDALIKNHIALTTKELTIEPRVQSAPEKRLYWITSPTDTNTHFKLINDLEKALAT